MKWLSDKRAKILFLAPSFLIYTVFLIIPILIACYYSFTNFTGIGKAKFVGFKNYSLMFHDQLFFISLKNTLIVLIVSFTFLLVFSFLIALMLNQNFKGDTVAKAMVFSPYIIAPIVSGTIWMFILNPQFGLINTFLKSIGLGALRQEWIGGTTLTPLSIAFVFTWQVIGFHSTIFLAGMKMVPNEIYEAASIDGANKLHQIFFITIPMMKETFVMNIVLIVTGVFKIYELVYQLTGGGPNHLSDVLVSYMYFTVFTSSRYGYGMAISVFILIVSILSSFLFIQNAHRKYKAG